MAQERLGVTRIVSISLHKDLIARLKEEASNRSTSISGLVAMILTQTFSAIDLYKQIQEDDNNGDNSTDI